MGAYTFFTGSTTQENKSLIDSIVTSTSGLVVDSNSIVVHNGSNGDVRSISFYDGSLNLGIGAGLLLSSGTAAPSLFSTSGGYTTNLNFGDEQESDADLSEIAKVAFSGSGSINDATWLEFDFTVTDPYNTKGITFDLLFGSEEYPEWSDSSYVDIAGVFLNGTNIALFNGNSQNPLSVIDGNLEFFNENLTYQTEYDGVSNKLTIYAPLQPEVNTIKIGVSDTGDSSLDSGLYIANFNATKIGGSGLSSVFQGSDAIDQLTGDENGLTYDLRGGNDIINPGYGNDIILAGAGDDMIYGGFGDNQIDGGDGSDTVYYDYPRNQAYLKILDNETIHVGANSDVLIGVETIQFTDGSYDTKKLFIEDDVAKVYLAYFGRAADPDGLTYWLADVEHYQAVGYNYNDSLKNIIDSFAKSQEAENMYPGMNAGNLDDNGLTNFIGSVYQNLFDRDPDEAGLAYWLNDAKYLQDSGIAVGTLIKTIIEGALNTLQSLDRTLIQNKAQVVWDYAKQYQLSGAEWDAETLSQEAASIVENISTDGSSVNNAYEQILTIVGVSASEII